MNMIKEHEYDQNLKPTIGWQEVIHCSVDTIQIESESIDANCTILSRPHLFNLTVQCTPSTHPS